MEISLLLARVLGITLIILYTGLLLNQRLYRRFWTSISEHPIILFVSGFIGLILGLCIIQVHNIWAFDWRGLITFFGWLMCVSGAVRILFPEATLRVSRRVLGCSSMLMNFFSVSLCLIGLYLISVGFSIF